MVQNSQESGYKYWAIRSFARTTQSFTRSSLRALLAHSTALILSLVHSLEVVKNWVIRCLKLTWFCPTGQKGILRVRLVVMRVTRASERRVLDLAVE